MIRFALSPCLLKRPCVAAMSTDAVLRYVSEAAATVTLAISGVRGGLSEMVVEVTVEVTVVATGVRVALSELTVELTAEFSEPPVDVTVEVTVCWLIRRNPVVTTRMRIMMTAARKGNLKLMAFGGPNPIF